MDETAMSEMSLSEKLYMMERSEWDMTNRDLRQHGLPAVDITHPATVSKNADIVVLSSETCRHLRQSIQMLVRDCDRRQELIQELILTNNQLREELKAQSITAEKLETKNKDLKHLIEESRNKLQNLQDLQLSASSYLHDDHSKMTSLRVDDLETTLKKSDTLIKSASKMTDTERTIESSQGNRDLSEMHHQARHGNFDKLMTMVESYENEISSLRRELSRLSHDSISHLSNSPSGNSLSKKDSANYLAKGEAVPNYKTLIKGYEKQIREYKKKYKEVENTNEILKLELQSRPELKDLRDAQLKIRKLQHVVKNYSAGKIILTPESAPTKKSSGHHKSVMAHGNYSSLEEELSRMLDAEGEDKIIKTVSNLQRSLSRLQSFAESVLQLVNSTELSVAPGYGGHSHSNSHNQHAVWCERTWQHVLPTLEFWAEQLLAVKGANNDGDGSSVTFLRGVVEHFQKLFAVEDQTGIYPRMNDVYTKLGEVHNVMKTLKDLLGLDEDAKSYSVVEAVARLCQTHNSLAAGHIKNTLFINNAHQLAEQLEEQEEFLSVFQPLLLSLLETLDVNEINQILPAVRALKLLAA